MYLFLVELEVFPGHILSFLILSFHLWSYHSPIVTSSWRCSRIFSHTDVLLSLQSKTQCFALVQLKSLQLVINILAESQLLLVTIQKMERYCMMDAHKLTLKVTCSLKVSSQSNAQSHMINAYGHMFTKDYITD